MSPMNVIASNFNFEYVTTRIILVVFKLMGLAPFSVRKTINSTLSKKDILDCSPIIQFSSSRFGCAYNLFLIPLQVYILIVAIPYSNREEYPNKSILTTTIELTLCALGYALLFMIWLTLGFGQERTVRLFNRLLSLDGATHHSLDGIAPPQSGRTFFLYVFIINSIMGFGLIYTTQIGYGFLVSSHVMLGLPSIISSWFFAQYVCAVKLIENRFKAINRTLLDCYVPPAFDLRYSLSITREFTFTGTSKPNIAIVRRAHANVCRIAAEISAFYSVPILFAIAHACYGLIYSCYYVIVPFLIQTEEFTSMMFVSSLFWISCRIVPIVVLAKGVTDVISENKNTSNVVKKLLTHSNNNSNDTIELRQFLLELLHRNLKFTACGFFSLDCTLVLSIVGMVITYLIILVQFRLGSTKTRKTPSQNSTDYLFDRSQANQI